MHTIKDISVESILDSRGVPTLSVTVTADNGKTGTCSVPSGASTGKYEACELRDDGTSHGGVANAITMIEAIISPELIGKNLLDQQAIDALLLSLDGTTHKTKLGGNSMLGVSIACAKAAAHASDKELYQYLAPFNSSTQEEPIHLYFNLINGGKHAKTKLAFQEYHLVPKVSSVTESLEIAKTVQDTLGGIIEEKYGEVERGDEGGYAVPTEDVREPLELLSEAVKKCGMEDKVSFALDVAASSFYDEETQMYIVGGGSHTKEELHDTYMSFLESFPIISIEDPFQEEDFEAFTLLRQAAPSLIVVGDDLTVTNKDRVEKAVSMGSVSGLIIKPNQIGTLSETIETINFAQAHGVKCIVSHRSGETMDDMIADIAKAFGCFGMKSGARGPKEREVKYERLSQIQ